MTYKILAVAFLAIGLGFGTTTVFAQQQPRTFFKTKVNLSDSDIQKIEQGQVVTKVLQSTDPKYGMLVFGAVYINASIPQFAAAYRDVKGLLEDKVYLDVQEFGLPPKLSDFDRLVLDHKDVDALQDCKPEDCDLQVFDAATFRKQINWNSSDKYDQVNQLARKRIHEAMTQYMSGGLKSFGSYTDRKNPLNVYQATKEMIGGSYYIPQDQSGGIYHYVLDYPEGKVAGADDFFYWENLDFGEGPTIRVDHVFTFPQGAGAAKSVTADVQLYASRYIRVSLQTFYCVPDTQNPGKPGFFLIEMNDSRLPVFGGLKLSIVRKVATSKAVQGTQDTLALFEKRLSAN